MGRYKTIPRFLIKASPFFLAVGGAAVEDTMLPLRTLVPPLDLQQQQVFASQASAGLNGTSVFWNGLAGVNNYRIPAIVQASGGRLVAFAEARHGGDYSAGVIATRTSDDGGDTWSPVAFAAGHIDTPAARQECQGWELDLLP